MSDKTAIEWTDATWNPVTGCTKVSPGCDHCYAETLAERFRGTPGHYFEHGFDVQLRPDKLEQPLKWRKPRRIFVNSMSDLFHNSVPDAYVARVFAIMYLAERHTFQLLTKRHSRMWSLISSVRFQDLVRDEVGDMLGYWPDDDVDRVVDVLRWPLPNVWLGVSAEDQRWADIRIPALLDTPATVRFVSLEPLLGAINLGAWLDPDVADCICERYIVDYSDPDRYHPENIDREPNPSCSAHGPVLDWVIVGGESGRSARPMHPIWVRSLRDQCFAADVPFLFKQWGGRTPKAGGRVLDGHTFDQYPDEVPHV